MPPPTTPQVQQPQPPPANPPPQDMTALTLLVGAAVLAQLGGLIASFVKWVGARIVGKEDAEKTALRAEVHAQGVRFEELRKEMDQRAEKQGAFYRAELEKVVGALKEEMRALEMRARQDATRAMHDAQTLAREDAPPSPSSPRRHR